MSAMRTLVGLVMLAALAACAEGAAERQGSDIQPHEAPAGPATYGIDAVTIADSSERRQTLLTDGSYSDIGPDGEEIERGTWREDGMTLCFDPADEPGEICYIAANPGEDGSFEKIDPKGIIYARLRRIDETFVLAPLTRFAVLAWARLL